jgi:hypothetical protein
MRSEIQVPLPKGWPNRIRSGVLHVISLAHFSLTFARSVAASSGDKIVGQNADR